MCKYLLFFEYDGTCFSGAQAQKSDDNTIQNSLEDAIANFCGERCHVYLAGRTDTGVHACRAAAHVTVIRRKRNSTEVAEVPYEPRAVLNAVNARLRNKALRIVECCPVTSDFHARHAAVSRSYIYLISCVEDTKRSLVLDANRSWRVHGKLDIAKMNEACAHFVGIHDFTSFSCVKKLEKKLQPIRTVYECTVEVAAPSPLRQYQRGVLEQLAIRVRAKSFLYHQVRLMVAALVDVGTGRESPSFISQVMELKKVNSLQGMAPPYGLYLADVEYSEDTVRPAKRRKIDDSKT